MRFGYNRWVRSFAPESQSAQSEVLTTYFTPCFRDSEVSPAAFGISD